MAACKRPPDTSILVQEVVCVPCAVCCSLADGEGSAGICHWGWCCSLLGESKPVKSEWRSYVLAAIFYALVVNWWYLWLGLVGSNFSFAASSLYSQGQVVQVNCVSRTWSSTELQMSLSAVADTPFALSSFCARGMLTLVLDFSWFSSFQCSFVWEQLTGQFLSPLVHTTHLWHFLEQPSFPFLCFRRDIWLMGHLRKSCENAVLSTRDGEAWEKCNNFIGEKHIKRCTTYMGEGKISSSQSWACIKSIRSSFLKPKLCFHLLNWILISWTGPNWMQKSRRVNTFKHHPWMQISDLDQNARKWCIAFWFYFCWFTYLYSFIDFSRQMLVLYILVDKISPLPYPDAYISLWQKYGSYTAVAG